MLGHTSLTWPFVTSPFLGPLTNKLMTMNGTGGLSSTRTPELRLYFGYILLG